VSLTFFFFFSLSCHPLVLPSFPTRRSSDLFGLHVNRIREGDEIRHVPVFTSCKFLELFLVASHGTSPIHRNHAGVLVFYVYDRRSEEHTSELQSRFDLVCRLLLEKKNTNTP